jgi:hypothetical protein
VQVTHSLENARFGSRVVHLKDGWVAGAPDAGRQESRGPAANGQGASSAGPDRP